MRREPVQGSTNTNTQHLILSIYWAWVHRGGYFLNPCSVYSKCSVCVIPEHFPGDRSCHTSDTWEALELPETGAGRNKCHRKESLRVPWLYLLTGKENTCGAFAVALLPMLTSQGKENSWSVGLQGKISSEILNQLKKGKNTPWLQWVACETWEILCWFLWEFLAKPVHHSMSAGLFFPAGRHEALEDSWASSINANVL